MMTFRNHRLRDFAVPMSTNWLLNDLAEAKGKQELYTRQSPQVLKALREMALVQSVESSNRIEGVTVAPAGSHRNRHQEARRRNTHHAQGGDGVKQMTEKTKRTQEILRRPRADSALVVCVSLVPAES